MATRSIPILPNSNEAISIPGINLPRKEAEVFEKQLPLMTAEEFCTRFGYSIKTIYEWKYRPKRNGIPVGLVVKFRGKLYIRTDILRGLIPLTNPHCG